MYIRSDLIRQCGPTAARNVVQMLEEAPSIRLCRTRVPAAERIEGPIGNGPSSRDRLSRAEERKTR